MIPPDPISSSWLSDEGADDVKRFASTSVVHVTPLATGLASDLPYPDPSSRLALVNEAQFDSVDSQDLTSAFLSSNLSFDLNYSDVTFTNFDPTLPWISSGLEDGLGPFLTEEPVVFDSPRAGEEATWYPLTSSYDPSCMSYTTNPYPRFSSSSQDTEDSFQTTADSHLSPLVDISSLSLSVDQSGGGFSFENPSAFYFADSAVVVDCPSYPRENIQMASPESLLYASSPSPESQSSLSEQPVGQCEWKNDDGTLCGEELTRGNLPGHLSKHGIKNMGRNHPTKCNWLGCKARKYMNRESIVRHIREVHLCIKRLSKQRKHSCS